MQQLLQVKATNNTTGQIKMKLAYTSPKTFVYGSLEELTQASGRVKTSDVLIFNGQVTQNNDSLDITIGEDGKVTRSPAGQ